MAQQILEYLVSQSNRFQREPYCPRCGKSFVFADVTFWIDGEDEGCPISLPVGCACDSQANPQSAPPPANDLAASTPALQDFNASQFNASQFNASQWKQAYLAALFESDKQKVNCLITLAETAIVLRSRELFAVEGDPSGEKAALDAALLGLHSLRGVSGANNSPVCQVRAANDLAA